MDRLYFRVLLNVFLALAVALFAAEKIVAPRIDERTGKNIEETLSDPLAVLADTLADEAERGGDPHAFLARSAARFRSPVALVPRHEVVLTRADPARLDRGEVVQDGYFLRSTLYAPVRGTDLVVKYGPLNPVHPFGEWRGPTLAVLFVIAVVLGLWVVLTPIRRRVAALSAAAEKFGAGDLSARAMVHSPDSIAALESSFNRMASEIERMVNAHQELLRTVSHELRTPLQRIHFSVAKVQDAKADQERDGALGLVDADLDELESLIDELLTYARLKDGVPPARQDVDVRRVVEDVCDTFAGVSGKSILPVAHEGDAPEMASCDPRLLRRAISNLVTNALGYAQRTIGLDVRSARGQVVIEVHDDGPGVADADRERIFDPFWRSDEGRAARQGFGLGLAIVRQIASRHDGGIEVGPSRMLGGACFRLAIPATDAIAAAGLGSSRRTGD